MTWNKFLRRKSPAWVDIPMYLGRRYLGPVKRQQQLQWVTWLQRPLPISEPHRALLLRSRLVAYQCTETARGLETREVREALLTLVLVGASWRKATRIAVSIASKHSLWTFALSRSSPHVRMVHEHKVSRQR